MTLQEQLDRDLKTSLKMKNDVAVQAIRMIKSEYPKYYKGTIRELDDTTIISIIIKFVGQEQIRLAYESGLVVNGKDPVDVVNENQKTLTNETIEFLNQYIPQTASDNEIFQWIKSNIELSSYKQPMAAMRDIKEQFPFVDGKKLKDIYMDFLR